MHLKILLFITCLYLIISRKKTYAVVEDTNKKKKKYITEEKESRINRIVQDIMKQEKIPGVSITIVKNNKTVFCKGYGYADKKRKIPVDTNTIFELCSNSKAFTGLAIMQLVQKKLIDLNKPVSDYIPWLRFYLDDEVAYVTVKNLLHHTSGIPFGTINAIMPSTSDNSLEKTIRAINGISLVHNPGRVFEYATINYDILALIIEYITNQSYENYMINEVFKPLKFTSTYFDIDSNNIERMSKGYKLSFGIPHEYNPPIYRGNRAAGYILSSTDDIAKWMNFQLGYVNNTKLDKSLLRMTHTSNQNVATLEPDANYGIGWFSSYYQKSEFRHAGNNPTFSSYITINPHEKLGIAVLSNINTNYTHLIAKCIRTILTRAQLTGIGADINKKTDKICSTSVIISCILIILCSLSIYKNGIYLYNKNIPFILTKQIIYKSLIPISFASYFIYLVYKIPIMFLRNIRWKVAYVWLPSSLHLLKYILIICIIILCMSFIIGNYLI